MAELLPEDLHHVLSRLPRDVIALLHEPPALFLGGGFIRSVIAGEPINDIDLFGPSKAALESHARPFAASRDSARFHETENAFTVITPGRHPVQFIHRWTYGHPMQLLEDFDFTIAQAVIWWERRGETSGEWCSRISQHYYADLASRRLRYLAPNRAEDAGGSLMRVRKFLARGYHIEAPSLGKVVARLMSGVHQEQIKDEAHMGTVLTGLLREVDPLTVVDGIELRDAPAPANAPEEDDIPW